MSLEAGDRDDGATPAQMSDDLPVAPGAAEPLPLLRRLGAGRPGLPVCLITGFLGAGKTTLVNHILTNSLGLRAAVFVNEYGSVDVDGALIRSRMDEDRVVSLTNGCVCCQVNEDLAAQLSALLKDRKDAIDVVIIETSGVCDPDPVLSTLQQVEDVDQVHLDSVICVVDASTVRDRDLGASLDAKKQLTHADVLLLNKVDLLAGEAAVEVAEETLRGYCRSCGSKPEVLRTVRAGVDLAALCALQVAQSAPLAEEPVQKRRRLQVSPHGMHSSRFATFSYKADKPFDMLKFEAWAESPPPGLLRAKGLLWMRGIPKYVCFHLAGRRTNPFETLPGNQPVIGSEIVFIARRGAVNSAAIRSSLNACLC